jgi:hypothetical protein
MLILSPINIYHIIAPLFLFLRVTIAFINEYKVYRIRDIIGNIGGYLWFVFYTFILSRGIISTELLINEKLGPLLSTSISILTLEISYRITKLLFKKVLPSKTNKGSLFLHTFVYSTSSVIIFILIGFIFYS